MYHRVKTLEAAIQGLEDGGLKAETAILFSDLLGKMYDAGFNHATRIDEGLTQLLLYLGNGNQDSPDIAWTVDKVLQYLEKAYD